MTDSKSVTFTYEQTVRTKMPLHLCKGFNSVASNEIVTRDAATGTRGFSIRLLVQGVTYR